MMNEMLSDLWLVRVRVRRVPYMGDPEVFFENQLVLACSFFELQDKLERFYTALDTSGDSVSFDIETANRVIV